MGSYATAKSIALKKEQNKKYAEQALENIEELKKQKIQTQKKIAQENKRLEAEFVSEKTRIKSDYVDDGKATFAQSRQNKIDIPKKLRHIGANGGVSLAAEKNNEKLYEINMKKNKDDFETNLSQAEAKKQKALATQAKKRNDDEEKYLKFMKKATLDYQKAEELLKRLNLQEQQAVESEKSRTNKSSQGKKSAKSTSEAVKEKKNKNISKFVLSNSAKSIKGNIDEIIIPRFEGKTSAEKLGEMIYKAVGNAYKTKKINHAEALVLLDIYKLDKSNFHRE